MAITTPAVNPTPLQLPTSLLPGLFRGVPFEAVVIGTTTGRRLITHEYPQREDPYTEDLGRSARRWRLRAFVVGETAPLIKDLLIKACQKPGAGTLVHKDIGVAEVMCESIEVSESSEGTNYVEFNLTFVEAGYLLSSGILVTAVSAVKAVALRVAVANSYTARHDASSQPGDVRDASAADHSAAAGTLATLATKFTDRAGAEAFTDTMAEVASDAATLGTDPAAAVAAWQAAFALVSDLADLRSIAAIYEPLVDASQAAVATATTPKDELIATNTALTDLMIYVSALSTTAEIAAAGEYAAYEDAIAARDEISTYLADVAAYAIDVELVAALTDLRGAFSDAITQEAMALPQTRTIELSGVRTALDLAWELYGDPDRAAELVERNSIVDPSAITGSLRVLTT